MTEEEIKESLRAAWLPKRAIHKNGPCAAGRWVEDRSLDPEFRNALKGNYVQTQTVARYFRGQNWMVYPHHAGQTYNLVYTVVRALVLSGVGAKVVHLLGLEDPPEQRGGIDFMEGLKSCEFLAVLGFYEEAENKPDKTRWVGHLLQSLDCRKMLHFTSQSMEEQSWWGTDLLNSFGELGMFNGYPVTYEEHPEETYDNEA